MYQIKRRARLTSAILSMVMLAGNPAVLKTVSAEALTGAALSGIYEPYNTISVECNQAVGEKTVRWLISDTADGDYSEIKSGTDNTLFVSKDYAEKWIKSAVTADGVSYESEPRQIARLYTKQDKILSASKEYYPNGINRVTPEENIFTVDGQEFILLDSTESDSSKFFVMSKQSVGKSTFFNTQIAFDMMCFLNNKNSINYYFNGDTKKTFTSTTDFESVNVRIDEETGAEIKETNGYKENPSYTQLPDVIFENIDKNHMWQVEPQMWEGGTVNHQKAYSLEGGIAIASAAELLKYYEKFGFCDFADNWWTRSPWATLSGGDGSSILITYGSTEDNKSGHGGKMMTNNRKASNAIRPVFYLDRSFFLDYPVKIDSAGGKIKSVILKTYSMEELLAAGYPEEDIGIYYNDYYVKDIKISGNFETTTPIYVSYECDAPQNAVILSWQLSESENGAYETVSGSVGKSKYIVPVSAGGKYIRAKIELANGKEFFSSSYYIEPQWKWQYAITDAYIKQSEEGTLKDAEGNLVTVKAPEYKRVKTPAKYTFNLDGQQFILLDTSGTDEYLVMSVDSVGKMKYRTSGQRFEDMAAFLNNKSSIVSYYNGEENAVVTEDYTSSGYVGNDEYIQLPSGIIDNIDYNHVWKIERKMYEDSAERAFEAGIVIPSIHEILKYSEKIGLYDERVGWWTRTPSGKRGESGDTMLGTSPDFGNVGRFFSQIRNGNNGVSLAIRPMFWLKADFFEKVKVDNMGTEVLKIIKENNSAEELGAIYDKSELASIFGYGKITAEFKNLDNGKTAAAIVTAADEAIGAELIFAVYDIENRLLGIDTKTIGKVNETMSIDGLPIAAHSAKLMAWDNISNSMSPIAAQVIPERGRITVFLAGDSTVADYADANKSSDPLKSQYGWGEVLQNYFDKNEVLISNFAAGGRSAKSFINEGRLDDILSAAETGDYIFVQFAHNDQWSTDSSIASDISEYKEYLGQYASKAEEKGVNVVFITPPVRRQYNTDGFSGGKGLGGYPQAMRETAEENNAPYFDLFNLSENFMTSLSKEETANYYMPNDPQHFNINGAKKIAEMLIEAITDGNHPLGQYIKNV